MGVQQAGEAAGQACFKVGRIETVIVNPVGSEGVNVVEHGVDGPSGGGEASDRRTAIEEELGAIDGGMLVEDGEGVTAVVEQGKDRLEVGLNATAESELAGCDYEAHGHLRARCDGAVAG